MPTESKIDFHELGPEIIDMIWRERINHSAICERIYEKYGVKLSPTSISMYKKLTLNNASDMVARDPDYKKKLEETFLDTTEGLAYAMKSIQEKLVEFGDHMVPDKEGTMVKDYKAHATYMALLLKELELLLRRSNEIASITNIDNSQTVVNNIQINSLVQEQIVQLVDEGQIPLEHCGPIVKEFVEKVRKRA